MDNLDLEINDRVQHPTFGRGTVTDILKRSSEPIAEVNFDDEGKKELAIRHAKLQKETADGLKKVFNNQASFKDFIGSSDHEDDHVHGNHWGIFFDDVEGFLTKNLQKVIEESQPATGWGVNHEPFYDLPDGVPETALLCYPGGRRGIKSVLRINQEKGQNELVSFFPFVSEGTQHTLQLKKIYPWSYLEEGQIVAVVGETMEIAFYDTDFTRNQGFYGPEHLYQFILAGFAYRCHIADDEPLEVSENTRQIFEQIKEDDPEFEIPDQLEMKGMAAFLPTDSGDRDDFEFRGPVKRVEEIEMLDQTVLRIRTTVARFMTNEEDDDFDLDIYVTGNALEGETPSVGDDISGVLWLQGYLWYPGVNVPITQS